MILFNFYQAGNRKDGSQLCHSCANYSKMNGIRPSTGGGATGATVRSPPAKTKVSSSNVSVTCDDEGVTIDCDIAEREQEDGDDLRQLRHQHHHTLAA